MKLLTALIGVVLKVNSNGRSCQLRRPIQCLYPLEVAQQTVSKDQPPSNAVQQDAEDQFTSESTHKPIRKAAMQARQRIHDWTSELID